MTVYHKDGYPTRKEDNCKCDDIFVEYCRMFSIQNKHILHFGTGLRHKLGVGCNNQVLGITTSISEHKSYAELIKRVDKLDCRYRVVLTNIYCLTKESLPIFDIVYLPHLGEYYNDSFKENVLHDDLSLVRMLITRIHNRGIICVFNKSNGWRVTRPIMLKLMSERLIEKYGIYKNLEFYRVRNNENNTFRKSEIRQAQARDRSTVVQKPIPVLPKPHIEKPTKPIKQRLDTMDKLSRRDARYGKTTRKRAR